MIKDISCNDGAIAELEFVTVPESIIRLTFFPIETTDVYYKEFYKNTIPPNETILTFYDTLAVSLYSHSKCEFVEDELSFKLTEKILMKPNGFNTPSYFVGKTFQITIPKSCTKTRRKVCVMFGELAKPMFIITKIKPDSSGKIWFDIDDLKCKFTIFQLIHTGYTYEFINELFLMDGIIKFSKDTAKKEMIVEHLRNELVKITANIILGDGSYASFCN